MAFRLKYLTRERDVAVIKAAAEKARWKPGERGSRGRGDLMRERGFSYTERNGTAAALVAEVEVERKSGRIWAKIKYLAWIGQPTPFWNSPTCRRA